MRRHMAERERMRQPVEYMNERDDDRELDQDEDQDVRRLATEIVSAYVSANLVPKAQLPEVIGSVFRALKGLDGRVKETPVEPLRPPVSIRRSVTPDYIVCLEDGKKLKMLKRHLRTSYNLTPQQYREKWGLPPDYPMVAPKYAIRRSELAKKIGLGRAGERPSPPPTPSTSRRRAAHG
jgi:predicted transcriptional regulator